MHGSFTFHSKIMYVLCDFRLFGVICRTAEPERVKFICHVMQADQSGSQVSHTIIYIPVCNHVDIL